MKALELIAKLSAIVAVEGDLEVGVLDGEWQTFGTLATVDAVDAGQRQGLLYAYADETELGTRFIGITGA